MSKAQLRAVAVTSILAVSLLAGCGANNAANTVGSISPDTEPAGITTPESVEPIRDVPIDTKNEVPIINRADTRSADDIMDEVLAKFPETQDTMMTLTDDEILGLYDIDDETRQYIDSMAACVPAPDGDTSADEILLIRTTSADVANRMVFILQNRKDRLIEGFSEISGADAEIEKAKNAKIITLDGALMFVSADDPMTYVNAFTSAMH